MPCDVVELICDVSRRLMLCTARLDQAGHVVRTGHEYIMQAIPLGWLLNGRKRLEYKG